MISHIKLHVIKVKKLSLSPWCFAASYIDDFIIMSDVHRTFLLEGLFTAVNEDQSEPFCLMSRIMLLHFNDQEIPKAIEFSKQERNNLVPEIEDEFEKRKSCTISDSMEQVTEVSFSQK